MDAKNLIYPETSPDLPSGISAEDVLLKDLSWLPKKSVSLDKKYSLVTDKELFLAAAPSLEGDGRTRRACACRSFWVLNEFKPLRPSSRDLIVGLIQNLHWCFLTALNSVCFDLDAANVRIQSSNRAKYWDRSTGREVRETKQNSAHALGFAYDIGFPKYKQLVQSGKSSLAVTYALDVIKRLENYGFMCDQYILEGSHIHFGLLSQKGCDALQILSIKQMSLFLRLPVRGEILKSLNGNTLVDYASHTSISYLRQSDSRSVRTEYPSFSVMMARSDRLRSLTTLPEDELFFRIDN